MDTNYRTPISRRSALKLLMGAGAATVAALGLPAPLAYGETEQELREKADQTQAEIDATQSEYNAAKARLDELAAEFQALSIEQAKTLDQIYGVEEEIRALESQITETQAEIEKREKELEEKQERLSKRISSSYKSGGADFLQVLLASTSFDDLISNIYYLDKITESDSRLIADVRAVREQLTVQKAQLESDRTEREEKLAELEELNAKQQAQLDQVRATQAEISSILAGLDEKVKALMAERDAALLAAEREAERARAEAARREEEARQAAAAAAASSTPSVSYSSYTHADPSSLVQGASGSQAAVISAAYSVPSPGSGLCAWWVSDVFEVAGVGSWGGNACDMYYEWCYSSDRSEIKPGMIIAVSTYPSSGLGAIYGHVAVYVGDGVIRENIGYINTTTLDTWIANYGGSVTVRWGWLGGVALA